MLAPDLVLANGSSSTLAPDIHTIPHKLTPERLPTAPAGVVPGPGAGQWQLGDAGARQPSLPDACCASICWAAGRDHAAANAVGVGGVECSLVICGTAGRDHAAANVAGVGGVECCAGICGAAGRDHAEGVGGAVGAGGVRGAGGVEHGAGHA
eukprot:361321-Chlamydomonas_euryale.AAC.2